MESHKSSPDPWARLAYASWFALAAHLVAGLAMAFILRHGLETNPDFLARLGFIARWTWVWNLGWLSWNVAALSMLCFCWCFVQAHGPEEGASLPLSLAVWITAVAVAADLCAEAIEMGVLPGLAEGSLAGAAIRQADVLFVVFHRTAVVMTDYLANGLYTLATALLVLSSWRVYPAWVRSGGLGVVVAGVALSAAALLDSVDGMFWANVALVPFLLCWLGGVALHARNLGR